MNNKLPLEETKKLLTDDLIQTRNTGISPIKQTQEIVGVYYKSKNLFFVMLTASIFSAFNTYSKMHTGRRVYLYSTLILIPSTIGIFYYQKLLKETLIDVYKWEEDKFDAYIGFYTQIKV